MQLLCRLCPGGPGWAWIDRVGFEVGQGEQQRRGGGRLCKSGIMLDQNLGSILVAWRCDSYQGSQSVCRYALLWPNCGSGCVFMGACSCGSCEFIHIYICVCLQPKRGSTCRGGGPQTSLLFKDPARNTTAWMCVLWWLPLLTRTAFIKWGRMGGGGVGGVGSTGVLPDLSGVCGCVGGVEGEEKREQLRKNVPICQVLPLTTTFPSPRLLIRDDAGC